MVFIFVFLGYAFQFIRITTVNVLKFRTPKCLTKWHNYVKSADPDQTAFEGTV